MDEPSPVTVAGRPGHDPATEAGASSAVGVLSGVGVGVAVCEGVGLAVGVALGFAEGVALASLTLPSGDESPMATLTRTTAAMTPASIVIHFDRTALSIGE
jgi:hypothetical protein